MSAVPKNEFIIQDLWNGIENALNEKVSALKNSIDHSAASNTAEKLFRDFIREYIPQRYSVTSGFIANASGQRSHLVDIIIADRFHIPPLCCESNYNVYAIESVCAAIEVTTAPEQPGKFKNDIEKLARIRTMGKTREYLLEVPVLDEGLPQIKVINAVTEGCPRTFLITCGREWKNDKTYKRNLVKAIKSAVIKNENAWINAVFSMSHGMLHFHESLDVEWDKKDALLNFLLFLNHANNYFITGKVDIQKYRPTIPDVPLNE